MEQKLRPGELRAAMECFIDQSGVPTALPADHPGLRQGVDEEGEAVISRWWSVWFFEGTRDQQEARLKELRLDPRFQTACSKDEIPIRFEGGARCDDVFLRLSNRQYSDEQS